ncbi:MAG TPA: hypothetical protein VLW25_06645 [Bryobacteraceae bacterium]|nr:hypothetical protein [Bryobacteraceae bacterium]
MIREVLQNLNFGHRMVLYRLLIALFLIGMIYYAFFFPKEGDRAIRRAADAMRKARSWKVESNTHLPQAEDVLYFLQEVECPSNSRSTRRQFQIVNGVQHESTNVNMTIGQDYYEYSSDGDKWSRFAAAGRGPRMQCEALARGDELLPLPPLSKWERTGLVSKGDRRDLGSSYCQEWKIAIPRHNMDPERASVCVGENDDLPRFFTRNNLEVRIFDWNVPLNLEAPPIAAPLQSPPPVKPLETAPPW